jgi:hypothetical protein
MISLAVLAAFNTTMPKGIMKRRKKQYAHSLHGDAPRRAVEGLFSPTA